MTLCQNHFEKTRELASELDPDDVAKWLLKFGYFPEQYVLPPSFSVQHSPILTEPYFSVSGKNKRKYRPPIKELEFLVFPKSALTVRFFGIIEPEIYHDLSWHITREWDKIVECIFNPNLRIYPYSFPIPVTKKEKGKIGSLRAGRMIYEFLEMAENDLVGEAHKYNFLLKTDIANFYHSIYTHMVSWALHGKNSARDDRFIYDLMGTKIDKLLQNANDGRTNGIAIGPAICDLISEILLAAVDKNCSKKLSDKKIDFIGVRFKDDYSFLCSTESDANIIAKLLQGSLADYNLTLSEDKSEVLKLPEGLFRPWTTEYKLWSLKQSSCISYKSFESTLLSVLRIDERFPGTGIIDRFLSELTSKKFNLKLRITENEARKTYSLLMLLKKRRAKSLPSILAIIEAILNRYDKYTKLREYISESLNNLLNHALNNITENEYDIIWILYFMKTVLNINVSLHNKINNPILNSVVNDCQCFFTSNTSINLFKEIIYPPPINHLLHHLAIFFRHKDEEKKDQKE